MVFSMDGESAAGPDGFTGLFFTSCWDIVGQDVVKAVQDFFVGADLPQGYTATLISLIPKVSNPSSFSEFRPISLCNFINKIVSKLLAVRLQPILPKLISPQQSAFVKCRLISDNVLLAQELCSEFNRKVRGSNVALKLDMAKTYDRVSWMFLIQVMRRFGFGEVWLDMIWRLISSCHFSVLVNGKSCGFFKSSRGLRQGDPISPALFIIGAEVLSRSLNLLLSNNSFIGFKIRRSRLIGLSLFPQHHYQIDRKSG